jgi:hypothetical protein
MHLWIRPGHFKTKPTAPANIGLLLSWNQVASNSPTLQIPSTTNLYMFHAEGPKEPMVSSTGTPS